MTREFVDIDGLEMMAGTVSTALETVPEEFFVDKDLLSNIMEPLRLESHRILSGWWVYRVIPSYYVGCNAFGEPDGVHAQSEDIFYGVYNGIDLVQSGDSLYGEHALLSPSIVFETIDNVEGQYGLSQTYLHVAVPLVDNIVAIEKVGFGYAN